MRCDWVRIEGPGRGPGDWQCRRCERIVSMGYRHIHPEMYPDGLGDCPKGEPSPGAVGLLVRYGTALARWAAAGMPARTAEEIERYYRRCLSCEHYDAAGHRCRRCGCAVNQDAAAYRNKIAMATERCPIGRWPDEPAAAEDAAKAPDASAEPASPHEAREPSADDAAAENADRAADEADTPDARETAAAPSPGAPSALGAEAFRADLRAEHDGPTLDAAALYDFFERVYVINLHTRPDRREEFFRRLDRCGWPFRRPTVYPAIHGDTVGVPEEFSSGGGAYGCRMSHLRILQDCLMAGVESVLILEDDADVRAGFAAAVARFLARVPADWQGIMLGGQHHAAPDPTDDAEVVRVRYAQRTHAYAARPEYMRALQRRWGNGTVHIDWRMRDWQHQFRVYAPARWLIGQAGGRSDIAGLEKPAEWWNRADPALPVVVLRAPREVFEELLRGGGWHGGRRRDPHSGYDVGLPPCADPTLSAEERSARLRRWIECVGGEAEELGAVCVLWHPAISREHVAAAWPGSVIELQAESAEEARRCLPGWIAASTARQRIAVRDDPPTSDRRIALTDYRRCHSDNPLTSLFINYWRAKTPERRSELDRALSANLANRCIDRVVVLCRPDERPPITNAKLHLVSWSGDRATFAELFSVVNYFTASPWDINIVANADIEFDETIGKLHGLDFFDCAFALTRWDQGARPNDAGQDAWIIQGPLRPPRHEMHFAPGSPACDWHLAWILAQTGYVLLNPYHDIHTSHHHTSNERQYGPKVHGQYIQRLKCVGLHECKLARRRHNRGGILGFSLWGRDDKYITGAIENARLAPWIYADWVLRFYVGHDVPDDAVRSLRSLGVEVFPSPLTQPQSGYFWRLFVADEPGYVRWGVRDADSRLHYRERLLIDEWDKGPCDLHTVRDHPAHQRPLMGCCVNGRRNVIPMEAMILRWIRGRPLGYGADEQFLAEVVFERLRARTLIHSPVAPPASSSAISGELQGGYFVGERIAADGELCRDDRERRWFAYHSLHEDYPT